jgi:hypothetical protein
MKSEIQQTFWAPCSSRDCNSFKPALFLGITNRNRIQCHTYFFQVMTRLAAMKISKPLHFNNVLSKDGEQKCISQQCKHTKEQQRDYAPCVGITDLLQCV